MNIRPQVIPFRIGGPIQDPADFAGRENILQEIANAMLALQNISLHGERRTGKTSLLLYLAHPASDIGLPATHIPVYFNFQEFAEASLATVWQAIADTIAEQIKQRHPDRQADYKQFLATIAESIEASKKRVLSSLGVARALSDLDDSGFRIHLLFDEFDQTVRNPNLGDSFYDTLRGLPTRAENISYVIASRTGLTSLQPIYNQVSSPFFNIFTRIVLAPFREDEVQRLIFDYFARAELGFSFAEKLCTESSFLYRVTGYHPFFLQTLCYHLCARLNEPDWPLGRASQEALEAFEKDAKPHFNYYWELSSEKEQNLIKLLAAGLPIDWNKRENTASLKQLKDRCLLVRANESKRQWRLFSSLFSRWVENGAHYADVTSKRSRRISCELHLFTGAKGGVGKTLLALLLSTYFLHLGRRVLVVDFNFFNPDLYHILKRLSNDKSYMQESFTLIPLQGKGLLIAPAFDEMGKYQLPMGMTGFYNNYLNKIFTLPSVQEYNPEICLVDTGYHIANFALPNSQASEESWLDGDATNFLRDNELNIWFSWTLQTLERANELETIRDAVSQLSTIGIGRFNQRENLRHVFNPYSIYPAPSLLGDLNRWFGVKDYLREMVHDSNPPSVAMELEPIMRRVSNAIMEKKRKGSLTSAEYVNLVIREIQNYAPNHKRPRNFFPMLPHSHLKNYTNDLISNEPMNLSELIAFLGDAYKLFAKYLNYYY